MYPWVEERTNLFGMVVEGNLRMFCGRFPIAALGPNVWVRL